MWMMFLCFFTISVGLVGTLFAAFSGVQSTWVGLEFFWVGQWHRLCLLRFHWSVIFEEQPTHSSNVSHLENSPCLLPETGAY
jgi:hypothetical protein